jgi:murein DD-endopeptidase MepM/ murein hydrolase activator NlpD
MLAGLATACSSDAARFNENPFHNPFQSRTSFDPPTTSSINRQAATASQRLQAAPVQRTTSQSLPAPSAPMMQTASLAAPSAVAAAPSATRSIASAAFPALAPVAPRATTALGPTQGWTAVGGAPVTLQQGESLSTLATRYGVPVNVLLAVNGLSSVGQAQPGQQIMIPAYNAVQGAAPHASSVTNRVAPTAPITAAAPVAAAAAAQPRAAVRDVATRAETEAEKRAAARLKEMRERETAAPAARNAAAPAPSAANAAEKERQDAAKKREAELKLAEARRNEAQKKAEAEKARLEAQKEREAEKLAARKPVENEPATTQSIPEQRIAARASERTAVTAAPPAAAAAAPQASAFAPAESESQANNFRWPAQGRVINGFGGRSASGPNDGINIAVPEGTPVKAAEAGTVIHADDALKGYGKLVLVRHANGFVTVYAHNGDIKVKRGENVRRGQVIAASGSSGNVTSPQLHFQIRKGSQPIDPMKHLASN